MKKLIFSLTFPFLSFCCFSQTCTYLAYDYFGAASGSPLNGSYSGQGWGTPWVVQNNDVTQPGFHITSASPMNFGALQSIANHASGGRVYLTAGRLLDNSASGPFADYLDANGNIGVADSTLWVSVLLRKDLNNDQNTYISLHNTGLPWCESCPSVTSLTGIGYFGAASNVGGERRWSLRINGTVYPTTVPVTLGTTAFLVLRMDFGATNTLALYVNPATLGNTTPAPTLTQTSASPVNFRSVALYLGDTPGNGSMDEIRIAESYACVAPDAGITVSVPPYADFTLTPNDGQAPLAVTFDGSPSSDPGGSIVSYAWDFGDGGAGSTGVNTAHTYHVTGILTVSLTVTDSDGLTNTAFKTVTVRDENNSFGCLTSMTLLSPAHCNADGGHLRVNQGIGSSFTLFDATNAVIPVSSGTEYTGLNVGAYILTAGGTNGCTDTFHIFIPIDSSFCPGWQPDECVMPIGTNSSGFADWVPERPMRNLLKHIRQEIVTYTDECFCWNVNMEGELTYDADGYPTHIPQMTSAGSVRARIILSSDEGNLQIGQQYVILYDGIGTLVMQGAVSVNSSAPGRLHFTNTGGDNIFFNLTTSQLGNHVRNIRVLRLSDEGTDIVNHPFYEGYLEKIAPFSCIRFMDWGATNGNPVVSWNQRTPVTFRTYGMEQGVPYEVMIQLGNYTQKAVWVCVPHLADENYIRQMAQLFRDQLDPDLTIYLEYSNEVWNWLFEQAHYNDQTAPSNLNYGRAYSEKARRVFRLWFEEFGAQSSRLKRVIGLQGGFNYLNEQMMSQIPGDEWDYGSPTWYFGLNHSGSGNPVLHAGSTPQDVVLNAYNSWLLFKEDVKQDYDNVKLFGKGIINYEGGQHFTDFSVPPYIQAMYDAQYTPQIYNLYNTVLDTIRSWGSELPMAFSLASHQESIYGSWGHVNDIDTPEPYLTTAPKYQALLDNICGEEDCPPLILLGNTSPISTATHHADERVVAYGNVPNGSNVTLRAGESIELSAGFQAVLGAEVLAEIEDCIVVPPPVPLSLGSLPQQVNLAEGETVTYTFDQPITEVLSRNLNVVSISIAGNNVSITGLNAGRTGLKITAANGQIRFMGMRVNTTTGAIPGLPEHLSIGSVSEDVAGDLNFWKDIQPGLKNKSMDLRYIYINGGPLTGWRSWGLGRPGQFARESVRHGLIPVFVYYNIPDDGESYTLDLAHANDVAYMTAYFQDLNQFMDSVQANLQGELYGIILEPDFLGYMQQNANPNDPASIVTCVGPTTIAPGAGTLKTLVQRINKTINDKRAAGHNLLFGWQLNLWAAGSSPIRLTDTQGFSQGRASIKTASEETILYAIQSGIFSNCADFVSIDKYGLDAVGHINDPDNPYNVPWFYNNDHWRNYLYYVKQFWQVSGYPVVLWQLPVGHINNSSAVSAYTGATFPPLNNTDRHYEDSSTSFFFGDTFGASNANRLTHFSQNLYAEPGLSVSGNNITWTNHLAMTRDSGVISVLMGAGVNSSTDGIGSPPTDDYFWVQKVQNYYTGGTLPLTPSMFTPCCGTTCAPKAAFRFPAAGQTIYQAPESLCTGCLDPVDLKFRLFDLDGSLTAGTLTISPLSGGGSPQIFTLNNLNSGSFTQPWLAPSFGGFSAVLNGTDNDGNTVSQSINFTLAEWTPTTCAPTPSWNVNTVYGPPNQVVAWEGGIYHNLWWTQGEEPGQGAPWVFEGACP